MFVLFFLLVLLSFVVFCFFFFVFFVFFGLCCCFFFVSLYLFNHVMIRGMTFLFIITIINIMLYNNFITIFIIWQFAVHFSLIDHTFFDRDATKNGSVDLRHWDCFYLCIIFSHFCSIFCLKTKTFQNISKHFITGQHSFIYLIIHYFLVLPYWWLQTNYLLLLSFSLIGM